MNAKDELSDTKARKIARLKDKAYRDAFVASQISVGLPFQIRSLREERNMKQSDLAEKTGMLQPRISAMESPGGAKFTLETLRRVASAFDVALVVRFAPFSELLGWSEGFDPDEFSVPSFSNDIGLIERRGPLGDRGLRDAGIMTGTNDEVIPRTPIGTGKVITFDSARTNHRDQSINGGV